MLIGGIYYRVQVTTNDLDKRQFRPAAQSDLGSRHDLRAHLERLPYLAVVIDLWSRRGWVAPWASAWRGSPCSSVCSVIHKPTKPLLPMRAVKNQHDQSCAVSSQASPLSIRKSRVVFCATIEANWTSESTHVPIRQVEHLQSMPSGVCRPNRAHGDDVEGLTPEGFYKGQVVNLGHD